MQTQVRLMGLRCGDSGRARIEVVQALWQVCVVGVFRLRAAIVVECFFVVPEVLVSAPRPIVGGDILRL